MGTVFFASYLIGPRDGLEAALVITILVAFLNRSSRRDRLREVWAGAGAAVLVSAGVGVLLTPATGWLGSGVRMELFEAATSLIAVALVTWMIWMRRTARTLKGKLAGRLETALSMGGWAVVTMAFFAVLREGVEMVLLVFAAAEGATDSAAPLPGMLAGIASAVGLGWVVTTATVRVNLGRFFGDLDPGASPATATSNPASTGPATTASSSSCERRRLGRGRAGRRPAPRRRAAAAAEPRRGSP